MLILVGALLTAGSLAMSARAQSNLVYAAEYNQSTNLFGTINLVSGSFTKISSFGSILINDVAYCPTNGMVYAISNSAALMTFNKTNGTLTRVASLSVKGIQSLAFRPSDSVLFGATQTNLYTINLTNGTAAVVGNFGSPTNLNSKGQNIRFASDGNLYVSNTSTNTDIYRINTTNGAATWMGEAVGYPYLMLQNCGTNMYSVFINLGSLTNQTPKLVNFDLSSFVVGGTNANGATHQITVNLVGAGTNFPANFTFSGGPAPAVTNLTVPVSATGPTNQTTVVGSNVVFSTTASGTGPYTYAWLQNGTVISGQTNSSLTLSNVTTASAATYSVIVGGAIGTVTNSATLTVNKASGSVVLGNLSQTYSGSAETVTATTVPSGLAVTITYNGSANAPTNAGSYTVIGTINDSNYVGSATNTLVINQAAASIALGNLSQTYNGSAETVTATTVPSGLAVTITYNGSASAPTNAGSYTVVGTINNANYQGSASGTLVIGKATGSITLGSLNQTYSGSAKAATATTTPSGLAVAFTYNGSATVPTAAGSYTVVGTINDPNYTGSATGTLVIAQATASVTLGNLSQTYSGTAKPATATTVPSGLAVNFTYNGSATVPTAAGSYTVVGTINDPNYTGSATATLTIDTITLAVTNLLALDKIYDGTTNVTLDATNAGLTGVLNSDDVTLVTSNAVAYFGDKNVGTNKPVTVTSLVLGGGAAANYTLANPTNLTANVSAAELTVSGVTAVDKVYDSTVNAQLNGVATLNGAVSGDDVSLIMNNTSAAFANPNVGVAIPVTVSGYELTGADAGNYTLTQPADLTANITAATLTITATANIKVYDGTISAAAVPTVSGLQGSDTVTGLAETYDTQNAGTGKTLNVSAFTINDGNSGNNYTVSTIASTAGVIEPALGSVTLGHLNQIYNGSALAATATTVPSGLAVSFTYNGSTTVPTAAGTYTVVGTISDPNYSGSTTGTLVIAQASGSITLGSLNQTYSGSAKAATATTTPSGLAVTFTYNGSTTVPTAAGTYTVVGTISDPNYSGSVTGTLVVGRATLTITATSNTKTYDGSTSAAAIPSVSGLQGSDSVTGLVEVYDTKNVGTGKTLSVSAYTVNDDNSGNNYTVSTVTSTAGVINPATLTITAVADTKTYDGTTGAAAIPTVSGLQGSDSVTGLAEVYDTRNAGTGKTLSVSAYTVNDGNSGNNYTVHTAANTQGVIEPAALTITAVPNTKTYDGTVLAAAVPTVTGLQGSDSVTGLAETYDTKDAGVGKTLSVSTYTINDGNSGNNYTVNAISTVGTTNGITKNSPSASGTIIPAALTVTADNKAKICGTANPPLTASYNGFVNGENTNALSSPLVLGTTATTDSGAGTYPITAGGAAAANYSIYYVNGTLRVAPTPQLAGTKVSVNNMDQYVVSYPTVSGLTYKLEYTTDLTSVWTPLGTPFPGNDGIVAVTNSISPAPQCFFRVQVLQGQ